MANFSVTDDSGFLALVDPDQYESFVSAEWTFPLLEAHFRAQMAQRRLLIWRTCMANIWEVEVVVENTEIHGMREVVGPIRATRGRLLLTSLDSLSMAAQFPDVTLPESHEVGQLLAVPVSTYSCRIVQRYDTRQEAELPDDYIGPDFFIEIAAAGNEPAPVWTEIPWLESYWLEDAGADKPHTGCDNETT